MINVLPSLMGLLIVGSIAVSAQAPGSQSPEPPSDKPAPVEKLTPSTYRVGRMRVDTTKREIVIPGTINPASTLEFVANTIGGLKAYESAMTLATNAISFNAALLLIGLDPARSRPPAMQFDSTPPQGDPVEIEVEWLANGKTRRVKIGELLFDQRTKKTIPPGPWVYTGSTFVDIGDGGPKKYLAELDGVLIGFMHGPQAIIDSPLNDAVGAYGYFVVNPNLKLAENTPISVTIKALPLERKHR